MVGYGLAVPWVCTLDRRRDCNSDKMERCVIRERGHQTHVFVFTEMGCVGMLAAGSKGSRRLVSVAELGAHLWAVTPVGCRRLLALSFLWNDEDHGRRIAYGSRT